MISIRSSADMARALALPLEPDLHELLSLRRDQLLEHSDYDLGELAQFLVAEPADTVAAIEGVVGVPLATNLVDSSKYGDPSFTDNFEYVERHGAWFEAVTIVSDDGYGIVLLVPDRPDIDPALLGLVRDHA